MSTPTEESLDEARRRDRTVQRATMLGLAVLAVVLSVVLAVMAEPWTGVIAAVVLLGSVALAWALPRRARGPQQPAERHAAFAALDAERVRAQVASHGEIAAVRDVRRQVPWATLGEVTAYVRGQSRDQSRGRSGGPSPDAEGSARA